MLLDRFDKNAVVTGRKQTVRAVKEGKAKFVFVARDAAPMLADEISEICAQAGIEVRYADSMVQLGHAAGIAVGASTCAVLK